MVGESSTRDYRRGYIPSSPYMCVRAWTATLTQQPLAGRGLLGVIVASNSEGGTRMDDRNTSCLPGWRIPHCLASLGDKSCIRSPQMVDYSGTHDGGG